MGTHSIWNSLGALKRDELIREGAYSQNQMKMIYMIEFQFFIQYFAESTHNFTIHKHEFGIVLSETI